MSRLGDGVQDGWEGSGLVVRRLQDAQQDPWVLHLKSGFQQEEQLCLSEGCFGLRAEGGHNTEEISWSVLGCGILQRSATYHVGHTVRVCLTPDSPGAGECLIIDVPRPPSPATPPPPERPRSSAPRGTTAVGCAPTNATCTRVPVRCCAGRGLLPTRAALTRSRSSLAPEPAP